LWVKTGAFDVHRACQDSAPFRAYFNYVCQFLRDRRGSGIAAFEIPGIVGAITPMRLRLWLVAVLLLGLAAPSYADKRRDDAKSQVSFGILAAQKNLWKEAILRFEKATQLDPSYAAAWNDLAAGYEQTGRFDDARKAYESALELDPKNQMILQNYSLFREIYDRQNRRRDR
jgi:tetratricopeptide (TPR) repeat protein